MNIWLQMATLLSLNVLYCFNLIVCISLYVCLYIFYGFLAKKSKIMKLKIIKIRMEMDCKFFLSIL